MAASPITLAAGTLVGGDFTIVEPLVRGGMGAVYVAEQRSTGKRRALKMMHAELALDATIAHRFELEARVGARIASDHVVEVVAAGVDAATALPYIVMELLDGEDLRERLRGEPLGRDAIRTLVEHLGHAMGAAHAAGVVHRDLKPENVFLARPRRAGAEPFSVKVLDFGIAKLARTREDGIHATRDALGSPAWMAPEQATASEVSPATDVWAIGLLAFELFTGKLFWLAANAADGTATQLLREIAFDPIPAASTRARVLGVEALCPRSFDVWFSRCLAREPHQRFVDGGEACRAFLRAWDEEHPLASLAPPPRPPPRPPPGFSDTDAASPRALRPPLVPRELRHLSRETPLTSVRPMKPPEASALEEAASIPQPSPRAPSMRTRNATAALALVGILGIGGVAFGWGRSPVGPRAGQTSVARDAPAPAIARDAAADASRSADAAAPAGASDPTTTRTGALVAAASANAERTADSTALDATTDPKRTRAEVANAAPRPSAVRRGPTHTDPPSTPSRPPRASREEQDPPPPGAAATTVVFRTESSAAAEPPSSAPSPLEHVAIDALGAVVTMRAPPPSRSAAAPKKAASKR